MSNKTNTSKSHRLERSKRRSKSKSRSVRPVRKRSSLMSMSTCQRLVQRFGEERVISCFCVLSLRCVFVKGAYGCILGCYRSSSLLFRIGMSDYDLAKEYCLLSVKIARSRATTMTSNNRSGMYITKLDSCFGKFKQIRRTKSNTSPTGKALWLARTQPDNIKNMWFPVRKDTPYSDDSTSIKTLCQAHNLLERWYNIYLRMMVQSWVEGRLSGQAFLTLPRGGIRSTRKTEGPYSTDPPTPDDILRLLELERVMVDRTIKSQIVTLTINQILTKELSPDIKQWEELIRENVGLNTFLLTSLSRELMCRANPTANLPYGMFLTRLYRHIMEAYPHLDNGIYDIVDRVMRPLALKQTRRTQIDRGKARHSVSSSFSHRQGTSSHQHDDDDNDDVETSRASTPSPTTYLNSLDPLNYQNYQMPSSSEQTDETLFEWQTDLLNQT
ncbi:hypothetical protein Tco_0245881 [Tanacetum coccineum]